MMNHEVPRYLLLNNLAEQGGLVILGGSSDRDIPLCELKQAFELKSNLYNRSISGLSVMNAKEIYDSCVAPLAPETVLLHIGEADLQLFWENPSLFDLRFSELIRYIKAQVNNCSVGVISLKNPADSPVITEMNKHLKYIAESEQTEFGDITTKRAWNPRETQGVVSFVYSIGFVRPLKSKRPLFDLIRILFCCEPAQAV